MYTPAQVTPQGLASGAVKQNYSPTANIPPPQPKPGNFLANTILTSLNNAPKGDPNTPANPGAQPTPQNTVTNGAANSTAVNSGNPAMSAYYGGLVTQLKSILSSLPTQQAEGVANINNSANASLNNANTGESQTLSGIATQRQAANNNKVQSLNGIDTNVADTVASFNRLVGQGHAGDSSFARDFVPLATAREGTQQRQNVFNTYGNDMAGLDTAENNAKTQYKQNVDDIDAKRNTDIIDFINGINDQADQLNQQAAQAAAYQQVYGGGGGADVTAAMAPFNIDPTARIAALKSLFAQYANPTYTVNPVTVTVPNLSNYTQDPLTAGLSASNPDTSLAYLPYLSQIKKQTSTSNAA